MSTKPSIGFALLLRVLLAFTAALSMNVVPAEPANTRSDSSESARASEKSFCGENSNIHALKHFDTDAAIEDFCSQRELSLGLEYDPDRKFYQHPGPGVPYSVVEVNDNYAARFEVRWGDFGYQGNCSEERKGFLIDGTDCKRKMKTVVANCPSSDYGFLSENGEDGCVLWKVQGVNMARS